MSHRLRTIRKAVTNLLAEVGSASWPVDPFVVAERKGLEVEIVDFPVLDVFGALILEGGEFRILVSEQCFGEGHRRFTLAHELGHYHIEGHLEELLTAGSGVKTSQAGHFRSQRSPEEREADWFASELLIPKAWGETWLEGQDVSLESLRAFADSFGVSLACAGVRYAELSDQPVAVVLANDGQIEWVAMSRRLRAHKWSRRYWKSEWIPQRSATSDLVRSPEGIKRAETRDGSTLLCEWFEGAPSRLEAAEEVVGLGSYGRTLTVLQAPDLLEPEDLEEESVAAEASRTGDWKDALRGYSLG